MFKKMTIALMALAFIMPLYAQDKNKAAEEKAAEDKKTADDKGADAKKATADKQKVTVWQEITLEDFETTPYTNKNLTFNVTSDQDAKLSIRDQQPSNAKSKKYLGLKVKTRGGDIITIKPAKDIIIDKYCKSISLWVYGKKTYGELSFMIQDTKKNNHKIVIVPVVNFLGWKQFTVLLTGKIQQEDDFLNQKKFMKIINFQYKTVGNKTKPSEWEFIYLDDFTATVRERYDDKQSDEW
ncbi:MAG: hypothetical protein KA369_09025 [Spirochaetes bacterium]|nr:hypothetical protein [Spirochaetota bacterium]